VLETQASDRTENSPRTHVVAIFPDRNALIRPGRAVLTEQRK
jgi:hypothetical protein